MLVNFCQSRLACKFSCWLKCFLNFVLHFVPLPFPCPFFLFRLFSFCLFIPIFKIQQYISFDLYFEHNNLYLCKIVSKINLKWQQCSDVHYLCSFYLSLPLLSVCIQNLPISLYIYCLRASTECGNDCDMYVDLLVGFNLEPTLISHNHLKFKISILPCFISSPFYSFLRTILQIFLTTDPHEFWINFIWQNVWSKHFARKRGIRNLSAIYFQNRSV